MLRWVIDLIYEAPHVHDVTLAIGSRVQLPSGQYGIITGGCVHVDVESVTPRLNITASLNNIKVM